MHKRHTECLYEFAMLKYHEPILPLGDARLVLGHHNVRRDLQLPYLRELDKLGLVKVVPRKVHVLVHSTTLFD